MKDVHAQLVWLLATLLALTAASVAHSQDAAPSLHTIDDYVAAVRAAERLLHNDPAMTDAARRQLAAIEQVELQSGEIMPMTPVLGAEGERLDGASAQARLQLVAQQLAAADADQTAARLAVLETVLAGAAFQNRETWLDQVRRWLANWLQQWFGASEANTAPTPVSAIAAQVVGGSVVIAGSILLLILLVRWLQTLLHAFVGDAVRRETQDDAMPATSAAARVAASRLAEQGDYRAAVRHLYLAALLTLQERRLVVRDPSLTNREVLAQTPTAHPVHAPLAAAVAVFDDVWYGVHEPDEATFAEYRATVDAIERCAAATEKQAPAA
ncbi:MAG TPA: hypothetical protein DCL15_18935 [Chloroflexi bacterium]|nr:hypothetical protein [Chloroflexota bacterium]HHW87506.1 DUF4129 domain-containing protein [Chloroflexota bacterium]